MTHVLVVDDDAEIRTALQFILEDAGYTLHCVEHGEAALAFLHSHAEPMVILLDVMMPRLDGLGVLRLISENEPELAQKHAFILMTARERTLPLSLARLKTTMNIPMLGKPFELERLFQVVAQAAKRLSNP